MNSIFKIAAYLLLAINSYAMTSIEEKSVMSSSSLGKITLYHSDQGYYLSLNDKLIEIRSYWVDPKIRKITKKHLEAFLNHGYIKVNQLDKGEVILRAYVRGLGGGPATAAVVYGVVKSALYGVGIAGATAAVIVTGGTAGAATGVIAAATTAGASTGATLVGAAIAGAGFGTEAALATTAAVTSMGCVVTAIETISCACGALFVFAPGP